MENQWLFPDGKVLPVVSGGSDDLNLPTGIPSLETQPSEPEFSDFAQGVLKDIPETDRPYVEKYMKQWDSNVTKKFQSIHEEYKPYKELGPVEDIQSALQVIQLMNEDPIRFYETVTNALKEHGMLGNEGQDDLNLPEFEGVPPQFVEMFNNMKTEFESFKNEYGGFKNELTQKEQIQQVDNLLKDMHNKHGEFDEDYVLLKLSQGYEPDDAIKSFQESISKYSSPRKPAPVLIPGAGSVPSGQVDFSKMSKTDRIAYAAQRIQEANS